MRSELNVTHSKKWKAEAFGDHAIAFVSWWLLRCRFVTWPGCWNRVTWLDYLPVDGREGCAFPSLRSGWRSPWWCGWLPLPPCGTNPSPGGEWRPLSQRMSVCAGRGGGPLERSCKTRLRRLLSVSPTYTASQSEHWIWYTTPARSSLGTLSLGGTRRVRMVL